LVKLWDPRQHEKPVTTIYTHKTNINCLSWSADGNSLATAAKDGALRIFDIRNMSDCVTVYGHDTEITAMEWHPHYERVILTGAFNGSLIYWITGESKVIKPMLFNAHLLPSNPLLHRNHILSSPRHIKTPWPLSNGIHWDIALQQHLPVGSSSSGPENHQGAGSISTRPRPLVLGPTRILLPSSTALLVLII